MNFDDGTVLSEPEAEKYKERHCEPASEVSQPCACAEWAATQPNIYARVPEEVAENCGCDDDFCEACPVEDEAFDDDDAFFEQEFETELEEGGEDDE